MVEHKNRKSKFETLIQIARKSGADNVAVIDASSIVVDDKLARYCRQPRCPNYARSINCPPHGLGPCQFRTLVETYGKAVVFKIDVPTHKLLNHERLEFFEKLQRLASLLETEARKQGFHRARGFAGGSCKQIFCSDTPCLPLEQAKACPHMDVARPSMSGLGVNVFELMSSVGWRIDKIGINTDPEKVPMGTLVGMVLL